MTDRNGVAMPPSKPEYPFNGLVSNNSSRGASPAPRVGPIPSSQLPPFRPTAIPSGQLPPAVKNPVLSGATRKMDQLSLSGSNTPHISPNKFSTSTPNLTENGASLRNNTAGASPIVPNNNNSHSNSASNQQQNFSQYFSQAGPSVGQFNHAANYAQGGQINSRNMPFTNNPNQPSFDQTSQAPFSAKPVSYSNSVPPTLQNPPPVGLQNSTVVGSQMPRIPSTPAQYGQTPNMNAFPSSQVPNIPSSNGFPTPTVASHNNYVPQSRPPMGGPPAAPPPLQRQLPPTNANAIGSRRNFPVMSSGPVPPQSSSHINYNVPPITSPPSVQQQQQSGLQNLSYSDRPPGNVVQTGFNRLWGASHIDLLQVANVLPPTPVEPPAINLGQEQLNEANCSSEVFRTTITKIPETASLLQKSRLPLGLLIHPFKDLSYLPIVQCSVIVRCRSCRTYINPFVYFVDSKRWKCNLCFRVNELPEEFYYDPVSATYGDPSRRPEIKSSTIEYIAPAEYMLRPPQPAVYLYLLDVSRSAIESGYLEVFCKILLDELKNIPGDARTQIGFLAYDSTLHFFSLAEGLSQPHEMTVLDIDEAFLPTPETLLINLRDQMEMVEDLLKLLPARFSNTYDTNSALGAALQVSQKMLAATGGRVTVFQAALPNIGPGSVTSREDPNQRATAETPLLNPANDFYKRLALECSGQQIAVDLFIMNSQYVDMATISGISRFSGGAVHHFPLFKSNKAVLADKFEKEFRRYLTRKVGFEAVMRVRCTRGLAVQTFHGNFFVRSTDLLCLPNVNPDAAFGMQVAIEENLTDMQSVCFQAALLYTSSKGERRIRVHTLCLPIANTLQDVIHSADQKCIIGLLGKMAVDRSMQSSLTDAREAFINAAIDVLAAYKFSLNLGTSTSSLYAPENLKLLPLYISAILKHPAFRIGTATRIDDRVKSMIDMKTMPLDMLMQQIYPDLYPIHNLDAQQTILLNGDEEPVPVPPRLQLSARCLDNKGAFLMDCGDHMLLLVCPNVVPEFVTDALGMPDYSCLYDNMINIPVTGNAANQRLHLFINYLNESKPHKVTVQVVREDSPMRRIFIDRLIEDRLENSLSYHEFLQHLRAQMK